MTNKVKVQCLIILTILILTALILLSLAVFPGRAAPNEYLWHRLYVGEGLSYLWRDDNGAQHIGRTDVVSCLTGGVIWVENGWQQGSSWATHRFPLYVGDWLNENQHEPRVEYFASCNVFIKSLDKRVANFAFTPMLFGQGPEPGGE